MKISLHWRYSVIETLKKKQRPDASSINMSIPFILHQINVFNNVLMNYEHC